MTSEAEDIKTNEFLRRRKLRLQQVREQSKDIAKKIRQRAKVEKLRQVVDLDAKKQKEYFECQEKLVKRLEVLYARGLENVGASHQIASEVTQQDEVTKRDLSKLRGKEAAAELRRKRQEQLDNQKKLLDRKLQAREAANEISRDKTSAAANKLSKSSNTKAATDDISQKAGSSSELANTKESNKDAETNNNEPDAVKRSDMATQWDVETMPHEWEPAVPALVLPTDKDDPKDSEDNIGSKTDKNKRFDLFALSKEMPSSLRGTHTHEPRVREAGRPSLTLVSEFLQTRNLRLRETENTNKKPSDDMRSLKQTIQRTRNSKPEVPGKSFVTNDKAKNLQENPLHRKNSVIMYNHSTRDTRDVPYGEDKVVVRDLQSEEDAYSQAMKEVSALGINDKEHHKNGQDMRNKVAVTKQNVEKEYKDTMNFLNSLPKDKGSRVIKSAYMDERRQQMHQESRQQKMQEEYKKIEKECRRHHNCSNKSRSKSKSPAQHDVDDQFASRDFQYSWMPIPESDGNLAIHAIPNTVKQGKGRGNTVKFSTVDSYHEYRSRHKHTPPTKDTAHDKQHGKKVREAVIIDKDDTESSDTSSVTSDTSSVESLRLNPKIKGKSAKEINKNLSDAERIIVYKVLDSRSEKKSKRQTKLLNEIAKSLTCIEKVQKTVSEGGEQSKQQVKTAKSTSKSADNAVSFEKLNEGVYKMVDEQGDNVTSMYFTERESIATTQDDNQSRKCQCTKPNNNNQESHNGAVQHWESGDCLQSAQTCNKSTRPSASKEKASKSPPPMQPSTVPSTSSFITATNDKTCSSDGGYIKLVDETGQEAGKFFIGATGFLNNNTYEVVIQLRKKDGAPLEKKLDDNTMSNKNKQSESEMNTKIHKNVQPTSSENVANDVNPAYDDDIHEILSHRSLTDTESKQIPPQKLQQDPTDNKKQKYRIETNTESVDDLNLIQSTTNEKDVRDKGVHMTVNNVPQPEQIPRAATTTCTQTALSSPIHRPVLFHMSSSTSTAYMSPPEIILPRLLRRDYGMADEEIYDPIHTIEMTEKKYCEEYSGCTCKKCITARKVTLSKLNAPLYNRKNKYDNKTLRTPPNSESNLNESDHEAYTVLPERYIDVPSKTARLDQPKCKHHHCGYSMKKHSLRHKKPSAENMHPARNINATTRNTCKTTSFGQNKKMSRSNLNPIIKDYVNKLLALSKEGIKAVEVTEQECSSVGTPGSSIINVPYNLDKRKPSIENTISLEQMKNLLKRQLKEEYVNKKLNYTQNSVVDSVSNSRKNNVKYSSRTSRKKPVHKVKSLNISKTMLRKQKYEEARSNKPISPSSTEETNKTLAPNKPKQSRSKSSPTPRLIYNPLSRFNDSESVGKKSTGTENTDEHKNRSKRTKSSPRLRRNQTDVKELLPSNRATATSQDSVSTEESQGYRNTTDVPVSMSTQTSQNMDVNTEANFKALVENKLHNMEKIADLTEKCTKRLSNLAKVLEEVRKNKSLVYSQISSSESTDSQSDHRSEKAVVTPTPLDPNNIPQRLETKSPELVSDKENSNEISRSGYVTILANIPKPTPTVPEHSITSYPKSPDKLDSPLHCANTAELLVKSRPKPPPALSRLHFKHGQEYIIPHELSTVLEVDSPMSIKHKSQSARTDVKETSNNSSRSYHGDNESAVAYKKNAAVKEPSVNPDLLQTNASLSKIYKFTSTESSEDSKFQMIDLKQFNEIMLEPFISIQEYAKQYNMEPPDEGSNIEDKQREDAINDDLSSLHSDGSLPDVIAELLKRNVIAEPFKFDTASNMNSTTISSESALSMLALSKVRKGRKRSNVFKNKENIGETSDTLSISSNPDLENAFKKLGMGWASSTLKKTKERLALSSSSNTSSSSLSQFKIKSFNQDIPALVSDSVSSAVNLSRGKQNINRNLSENAKNVEQQTNLSNSMTVKEFLRNELANKITFNNKSMVNYTEEEFVSLFETKMPEEMKETSQVNRNSVDSAQSNANRARTSTPVQLFKSMTYHSSSSSNVSNGLFSNVDDLSSVKMTSNSMKNHSTPEKDDLTIPNFSLRMKKSSECSKSD